MRRGAKGSCKVELVLNRLPDTKLYGVVVVARLTERISATFQPTVGTDRRRAISASCHGRLAARRTCVTVTGYVFDLAKGLQIQQ
jgi:hypothetical protein